MIGVRGNTFFRDIQVNTEKPMEKKYDCFRFVGEKEEEQEVHFLHAHILLLKTSLMKKASSYSMPQQEFVLVDDYWYCFVLNYYLGAKLIKIQNVNLYEEFEDHNSKIIAMHKNQKIKEARKSFYSYHMKLGWPMKSHESLMKNNLINKSSRG